MPLLTSERCYFHTNLVVQTSEKGYNTQSDCCWGGQRQSEAAEMGAVRRETKHRQEGSPQTCSGVLKDKRLAPTCVDVHEAVQGQTMRVQTHLHLRSHHLQPVSRQEPAFLGPGQRANTQNKNQEGNQPLYADHGLWSEAKLCNQQKNGLDLCFQDFFR